MRSTDELYAEDIAASALASSVSASLKKTSAIKKVQKMMDMNTLMTTMKIKSGCSMLASAEELSLNRSVRRVSVSPDADNPANNERDTCDGEHRQLQRSSTPHIIIILPHALIYRS